MYILDTNVISEFRKKPSGRAEASVIRWSESVAPTDLFLSTVAIFEIEMGIRKVALRGDSTTKLRAWLEEQVLHAFVHRILPIDQHVAMLFAAMMVPRTRPYRDTMVAATAQHHGYTVVTRNVKDFAELPVKIFNPWEF